MWHILLRLWWLEGGVWEARERAIREGEGEEGRGREEGKRRKEGGRTEGRGRRTEGRRKEGGRKGRGRRKEGREGRGEEGRDQINYRRKPFSDKWWSYLWQLIFLYYTNRCFVYQPNKSHSICSIHRSSDLLPSSLLFYSVCFASLHVHFLFNNPYSYSFASVYAGFSLNSAALSNDHIFILRYIPLYFFNADESTFFQSLFITIYSQSNCHILASILLFHILHLPLHSTNSQTNPSPTDLHY